jgi:hypothetical protein
MLFSSLPLLKLFKHARELVSKLRDSILQTGGEHLVEGMCVAERTRSLPQAELMAKTAVGRRHHTMTASLLLLG